MKARFILAGTLSVYAGLWALTATLGASDVRSIAAGIYDFELVKTTSPSQSTASGLKFETFSPAPLLVKTKSSFTCGPLCGHSESAVYLWLPGQYVKLLGNAEWINF